MPLSPLQQLLSRIQRQLAHQEAKGLDAAQHLKIAKRMRSLAKACRLSSQAPEVLAAWASVEVVPEFVLPDKANGVAPSLEPIESLSVEASASPLVPSPPGPSLASGPQMLSGAAPPSQRTRNRKARSTPGQQRVKRTRQTPAGYLAITGMAKALGYGAKEVKACLQGMGWIEVQDNGRTRLSAAGSFYGIMQKAHVPPFFSWPAFNEAGVDLVRERMAQTHRPSEVGLSIAPSVSDKHRARRMREAQNEAIQEANRDELAHRPATVEAAQYRWQARMKQSASSSGEEE